MGFLTGGAARSFLALIVSAAALAAAPARASVPSEVQGTIEKVSCPFDASKAFLPVDCGRLTVPENYDEPGRTIDVAFMIVHPKHKAGGADPVVFLGGGPGAPNLVPMESFVSRPEILDVVTDRDWIFFDPRGAGRSVPQLFCGPDEQDGMSGIKHCRDRLINEGADLSQYNSARSASDMEALKNALGIKQWNVWGVSYGSRLAFTFTRYYPASVRLLVIDGPYLPEDQESIDDLHGQASAINRIFWKCAQDSACATRYPDLKARFLAILPKLRQQPLWSGSEKFDDTRVAMWMANVLYGGAHPTFEECIQYVLAYADAAARGDAAGMLAIEERVKRETPPRPNFPQQGRGSDGMNMSVNCNEETPFESVGEFAAEAAKSDLVQALMGPRSFNDRFKPCALWPSGRADPIENTRVDFNGPILVFSGELDPTLSGLSGYKIEAIYPGSRNIVFKNSGHAQFYIRTYWFSPEERVYRLCALKLGHEFIVDPTRKLDASCAEARNVRLVQ